MALVLGHRGAPTLAPENTIAAFVAAARLGADGMKASYRRCNRRAGIGSFPDRYYVHDQRFLNKLGIPNLHVWSWALQMRCLWFQKTIPSKPWVGLEIPEHFNSKNLYANALLSHVGNGSNTLF